MELVGDRVSTPYIDSELEEWLCGFIESQQAPSGALLSTEFRADSGGRGAEACVVFPTALGMRALQGVRAAFTRQIVMRGQRFLEHARGGALLWRHWSYDDRRWDFIPFDVDDTAVALQVAPDVGVRCALVSHCLSSVESFGEVRTWIDGQRQEFYGFYQATEAALDDHDLCVVANLVASLGVVPGLEPALRALDRIDSLAAPIDKWYLDWPMRAYCLAHALLRAPRELAGLRARLAGMLEQVASCERDTSALALAARTISEISVGGAPGGVLAQLCALRELFSQDGQRAQLLETPIYFGGPKRAAWWCSQGMVACVVLEALSRGRAYIDSGGVQ